MTSFEIDIAQQNEHVLTFYKHQSLRRSAARFLRLARTSWHGGKICAESNAKAANFLSDLGLGSIVKGSTNGGRYIFVVRGTAAV